MKANLVGAGLDVLDSHPTDRCRSLRVKEEKQPSEPIFGLKIVIVQETACDVPAVLVIQWLSGAVPADGGNVDC